MNPWFRLVFLLAIAALGRTASAQDAPPCTADIQRLCAGVDAAGLWSCLYRRLNDLAPACQQQVKRLDEIAQQGLEACKPDLYAHCERVVAGGGAILGCLASHRGELTPLCGAAVGALLERGDALRQACAAESQRLCPKATPGTGQLYLCLSGKLEALSRGCQAALGGR
jgi:hypothetical protein